MNQSVIFCCWQINNKELTQEAKAEAESYRDKLGILSDSLQLYEAHSDEFPAKAQEKSSVQFNERYRGKAKSCKRKAKIAKTSRRANRKK